MNNQVALYIYVDVPLNNTAEVVSNFQTSIVANGGTFEAGSCLIDTLNSLGGYFTTTQIAKRIELFDDENISITSSIQDIADISKAKTEFTQSFTIPASKVNNQIFKHWYESAIDGGFDQRIKYDGFIEIDTIPFRVGGFALNNVSFKENMPENYNITFYGKAKSIKDILKEDNLGALDYSVFNHPYNSTEIYNRVINSTYDISYPLFAYDRLYDYNNGSANDITTNTGAIEWDSLFPAVKISTILNLIGGKYGLNFQGTFLYYIQFYKLSMLFKNSETITAKTAPLQVNFTNKSSDLNNTELNLTTDEIGLLQYSGNLGSTAGINNRRLKIKITPTVLTIPYDVLIYKNGVLFNSFNEIVGDSGYLQFFNASVTSQNINDKYSIFVQSDSPMTFTSALSYWKFVDIGGLPNPTFTEFSGVGTSQVTVADIAIGNFAPDIKLIDFLGGLIKMFNLVIIPIDEVTYELIPLELYYNNGEFNDISKNIITDNIEIKKTSMYKNINFKYQKSEAILNNAFNDLFAPQRGFDYGDLTYEQIDSLESSTFTVDLPFENPLYERKPDSYFQTITFKNKDLNNYTPKPVLIYDNDLQSVVNFPGDPSIKMTQSGGGYHSITQYKRFSNDINNGGLLSINWGEEISSWSLVSGEMGLYKRHYANYLGNIFSIKGRLLVVKCIFNSLELASLKLNNRIVIRDKRYTINKLTSNLINGESTLELLTDYREGIVQIANRYVYNDIIEANNQTNIIDVLLLKSDASEFELLDSDVAWIGYAKRTETTDVILSVAISPNATGFERQGNIIGRWLINGVYKIVQILIVQDA